MAEKIKNRKLSYYLGTILVISLGIVIFSNKQINATKKDSKEAKYDLIYPAMLINLAKIIGMEPLEGKRFQENLRLYKGQGAPYVFSVLTDVPQEKKTIPANVVFWCQKEGKKYLIYAEDGQIKDIISKAEIVGYEYDIEGSHGMVIYDGILGINKDLSSFSYLDKPDEYGPKEIYPVYENGFLPIIIYQESSTLVLYRYKDRWLKYVEVDE